MTPSFAETLPLVQQWALDRHFMTDATVEGQIKKLFEEAAELALAIGAKNQAEEVDGIGDCMVVLTMICLLRGYSIEACYAHAYEQIKDRKGRMVNGKFVKQEG